MTDWLAAGPVLPRAAIYSPSEEDMSWGARKAHNWKMKAEQRGDLENLQKANVGTQQRKIFSLAFVLCVFFFICYKDTQSWEAWLSEFWWR